jgi:hypothetical protein
VPENIFVVVALATGFSHARELVLFACSLLLAFSAVTSAIILLPRVESLAVSPPNMQIYQQDLE